MQLLQQLSSSVPPPLWLTALDSDAANGLRLRGLSRSPAAITQFERRLAGMPALPWLRWLVAQRGGRSFHLAARWGVMDSRLSSGLRFWLSLPGWLCWWRKGWASARWRCWAAAGCCKTNGVSGKARRAAAAPVATDRYGATPTGRCRKPLSLRRRAPIATGDLASVLQRSRGALLRWQRQEKRRGKR
ncbi:PilN domain-containing protein [Serratia ureilytica]